MTMAPAIQTSVAKTAMGFRCQRPPLSEGGLHGMRHTSTLVFWNSDVNQLWHASAGLGPGAAPRPPRAIAAADGAALAAEEDAEELKKLWWAGLGVGMAPLGCGATGLWLSVTSICSRAQPCCLQLPDGGTILAALAY